jgi:hypothetical protein
MPTIAGRPTNKFNRAAFVGGTTRGSSQRTGCSSEDRAPHPVGLRFAILLLAATAPCAYASDWPQWCGSDAKNMVSSEKGLPESFVPGEKQPDGSINLATAHNVATTAGWLWAVEQKQ